MLEKNITQTGHDKCHTSSKPRQENAKTTQPKFNIGLAIDEFLRVHNCGPLLESDDESESCYSRSMDSVASRRSRDVSPKDRQNAATKSPVCKVQDELRRDCEKSAKDEDPREMQIKALHRELDASQETILALEAQLSSNILSPMQIRHLVNQKREIEESAVEKRMLEKQLKFMQQQLIDAKQDAANAAAAMQTLKDDNKKLEDALLEMKTTEEDLKQKLADIGSTEKSPSDWNHVQRGKESDLDSATIQQLRLDLNEAHSVIKRLEKDRLRERRHYQRLMEGAANNRSDLELRIEQEMENNLEMMRKCYVLEQKLNDNKKMVKDLESELNRARDEVAVKNREHQSLLSQLDHFKRIFHDGERQTLELGCLKDINESLNDELASSIKENKRLKEELRRLKKFSSYRAYENLSFQPIKATQESKNSETKESCYAQDDDRKGTSEAVFTKALQYLGEMEGARGDFTSEAQINATTCDHDKSTMQQARSRFERLRSEYLSTQNTGR
jgi:predicted RNase H-like nuclease (RuvC/YqgF family)